MAKTAERLLQQWKNNPPAEASVRDVKKVAEAYFEEFPKSRGNHIKVRHRALCGQEGCGESGTLDIPTVHGRKVIKVYIKLLVKSIEIIKESSE